MAKHTPGPWVVATGHGWNYEMVGPADADHYVAAVYGLTKNEANDREVAEANARLIAAAPDMRVLLQEFLARYEFHLREIGANPEGNDLVLDARQVLAKAGVV